MELISLEEKGNRLETHFTRRPRPLSHSISTEPLVLETSSPSEVLEAPRNIIAASNLGQNDTDQYFHGWKLFIIITSLCLGTFLVALDVSIIGVAIPRITTDFHAL
jgi:hypothetical protein